MEESVEKDTRLINIYLKIHQKKALTLDDLGYLAEYDPECFRKTCENVVYNLPEAKAIMEPAEAEPAPEEPTPEGYDRQSIEMILENLKRLEVDEFPVSDDLDTDVVKRLLGNLYMELLYPHDDKYQFIDMADSEEKPVFDKKA